MKIVRADVVVVGGGPGGVSAAIDLARGGARVVLIEKEEFPRVKPCAGGISIGSLQRLKYDISSVTRSNVTELRLSHNLLDPVEIRSAGVTLIAMTKRSEFDQHGLQFALSAGCDFLTPGRIIGLEQDDAGVTLRYPNLLVQGRYVVAADGSASTIRRFAFGAPAVNVALGIEANVDAGDVTVSPIHSARIDFGVVKGGYAWVFPKGDHYNVGLYTYHAALPQNFSKATLKEYASSVLGSDKLADFRGFPLGTHGGRPVISKGRILFVGDAGGFCNSITGEGIYGAVLTGQLAAEAILGDEEAGRRYARATVPLVRKCRTIRAASWPFYRALPFSYPFFSRRLARAVSNIGG